jgi:hypothetical protein
MSDKFHGEYINELEVSRRRQKIHGALCWLAGGLVSAIALSDTASTGAVCFGLTGLSILSLGLFYSYEARAKTNEIRFLEDAWGKKNNINKD